MPPHSQMPSPPLPLGSRDRRGKGGNPRTSVYSPYKSQSHPLVPYSSHLQPSPARNNPTAVPSSSPLDLFSSPRIRGVCGPFSLRHSSVLICLSIVLMTHALFPLNQSMFLAHPLGIPWNPSLQPPRRLTFKAVLRRGRTLSSTTYTRPKAATEAVLARQTEGECRQAAALQRQLSRKAQRA